jgi:glucose-1-phosphate thymidylyltransferase
MKGVILAGGTGSRMSPLTDVTNKHLLPIYNRPMIDYPIETLKKAGIKEILIISGREHVGHFSEYLGSGKTKGLDFTYRVQDEAGGIAQALGLAEKFVGKDSFAVILGDNIFEDNFTNEITSFEKGSRIFLKEVNDANRFGVAELDGMKVIRIEEKPDNPKSRYAVTGLYIYDSSVFEIVKTLKPSSRNELEITDVNNHYVEINEMDSVFVKGFWSDAGTFESLYKSTSFAWIWNK